jgi:hypothetical protein
MSVRSQANPQAVVVRHDLIDNSYKSAGEDELGSYFYSPILISSSLPTRIIRGFYHTDPAELLRPAEQDPQRALAALEALSRC